MKQLQYKVKALRNKMDWSQEDLARYIGVSLSTAQRWETKGSKPHRLAQRELEKLFRKAGIHDRVVTY
jgi:DNA-binding transcriptional regulator YiaG